MKKSELKQIIKEEIKNTLLKENYTSESIKEFIKNNDTTSPYKPSIKFFGEKKDSKHLDISWDIVEKIAEIVSKNNDLKKVKDLKSYELTDNEIKFLVALYNKYSGQGPIADENNYNNIVYDYAITILNKYIKDKNSLYKGRKMAIELLQKLKSIKI